MPTTRVITVKCPYCDQESTMTLDERVLAQKPVTVQSDWESGKSEFAVRLLLPVACAVCGAATAAEIDRIAAVVWDVAHVIPGEVVRIASAQVELAVGVDVERLTAGGRLFQWTKGAEAAQTEKLVALVEGIVQQHNTQIVCLPELAVPSSALGVLREVSESRNVIIIAGSHYQSDRLNVCPILVPGYKALHCSEKIYMSPFEDAQAQEHRMRPGNRVAFLKTGVETYLLVLICKDFLHLAQPLDIALRRSLSIVLCVMCTSELADFYEHGRILARNGKFTVLCSASGTAALGERRPLRGGSAFFGSVHRMYLTDEQLNDADERLLWLPIQETEAQQAPEGVIVATFDTRHTFAATVPTERARTRYCNFSDPAVVSLDQCLVRGV